MTESKLCMINLSVLFVVDIIKLWLQIKQGTLDTNFVKKEKKNMPSMVRSECILYARFQTEQLTRIDLVKYSFGKLWTLSAVLTWLFILISRSNIFCA